jgi:hypothetical protein
MMDSLHEKQELGTCAHLSTRLRLTDPERSTLAEIGKRLGCKALKQVARVLSPIPFWLGIAGSSLRSLTVSSTGAIRGGRESSVKLLT